LGKQQVRIAYVLNLDSLKAAMECLDAALKAYPGRVQPVAHTMSAGH
jgi:aspartate aminotransferase